MDYLCAARTAPYHSYRNPVERIMSILNLGRHWLEEKCQMRWKLKQQNVIV